MACCRMARSQHLNRRWLVISEALWHSHESNFKASAPTTFLYNEFENDTFKIIATSPKGQWVKMLSWKKIVRSLLVNSERLGFQFAKNNLSVN